MSKTDTSAAAVERLAAFHALSADRYCADEESGLRACAVMTAATLRALLAERDEAQAEANAGRQAEHDADQERDAAIRERDAARAERDEAQRLVNQARAERDGAIATLALYRANHGCTRGQRTTQWCGEASKLRRAWLRVIQAENQCPATGGGCLANRCGCVAEMEVLINAMEEPGNE